MWGGPDRPDYERRCCKAEPHGPHGFGGSHLVAAGSCPGRPATPFADILAWVREWALDPRHEHTLAATPLDLDEGIARTVLILAANGVETFESCQGGDDHAFHEPTVRFYGGKAAGFHALSVSHSFDLRPTNLRRYWYLLDQEPVGPHWEMTFA